MAEFYKGEYVKYSNNGVCFIEDINTPDFDKKAGENAYYILRPINDKSTTIFVPKANELLLSKMRRLLTKDEIDGLIFSIGDNEQIWIDDRKQRLDHFSEVLKRNDPLELLRTVGCIYLRKQQLESAGNNKKLSLSDLGVLEQAEKLIENEFSFVLGIPASGVGVYIREKLGI